MKDNTLISYGPGGTTLTGDAILLYRNIQLRAAISLYAKSGIQMTRAMSITRLLRLAAEVTKKTYKLNRDGYAAAVADLDVWISAMKAAIPTETRKG